MSAPHRAWDTYPRTKGAFYHQKRTRPFSDLLLVRLTGARVGEDTGGQGRARLGWEMKSCRLRWCGIYLTNGQRWLSFCGHRQVVRHQLPKLTLAGSSPVARSRDCLTRYRKVPGFSCAGNHVRRQRDGHIERAGVCGGRHMGESAPRKRIEWREMGQEKGPGMYPEALADACMRAFTPQKRGSPDA